MYVYICSKPTVEVSINLSGGVTRIEKRINSLLSYLTGQRSNHSINRSLKYQMLQINKLNSAH